MSNKQRLSRVYGEDEFKHEYECVALMFLTDDELLSLYGRTENAEDYEARSYCITELGRRDYHFNGDIQKGVKGNDDVETEEDLQRMWDYIDSIDDDYLKQEVLDNYYRTHDYVNGQYIPEDVISQEIEDYERNL